MKRFLLLALTAVLLGCSSIEPIGDNRKHWDWLMERCEKDLEKRYAGYMGKFDRYHCAEAEDMRERITGIEDSSAPGAMDF